MRKRFVWDRNLEKVVPIEERTDCGNDLVRNLNPFAFERVDTLREMQHTLSCLESDGKLKGKAMRDAQISLEYMKRNPQPIVDYQKTGHPMYEK